MNFELEGNNVYAYTAGKPLDPAQPTVVFLHGAQHDHSVWGLQSRYLAHHGMNVLALDLPGHHRSTGAPLSTIGEMADRVVAVLDAAGLERAAWVGHSMGSLIALDAAARHPERVSRIALVGTAYPMKVSDVLLEAAAEREPEAIALVNAWSHSTLAAKPSAPGPGFWTWGGNQRLMERVAKRNPAKVFLTDFEACNGYDQGWDAAARVKCPVLAVLGARDQMTPPRAAQAVLDALREAGVPVTVERVDAGHAIMTEQPDALLDALVKFMRH
ncbi:alpha/beta fold hydrolase [Pandoraea pulmonicola]|uniref:Alpha/beta hydrolase n=1 Tax=Pandoraea pulmonicola TaxID=93221 RepID=A0AAJ4ZGV2_PANPU|nr:alpha/beta hydrolase [Pandoraea pulmonicola]AJC22699.1 alpha/beta hydrolase [Pandoraea pulmonicola]SUA93063.1 Dihydrolipoyllysine-residue acetyltransferase component of acetoin cleaving system [Pandoraea pulmonicola]